MIKDVIVIVGPTAVGKTKLGVELAKKLDGEVISGDSMQIYKHMDIGTAKVTEEETEGIVHHLVSIKEIDESYSVSDFQSAVRSKIKEIHERNKTAIIVGGTGLYIKAALYDYTFNEQKSERSNQYDHLSNEELYAYLMKIDPVSAKELHPNNRRRVSRAIEIFEAGQKKSELVNSQQHMPIYPMKMVGLTLPRDLLYERINLRVDKMYDHGLVDEFNHLIELGAKKEYQSMKAIGYQEFYQDGDTKELIKQHSRNYAKRQYTWFKNQFDVHWVYTNLDDFNITVQNALDYIERGDHYKYIAFDYHSFEKVEGILEVKEGYTCPNSMNPTKYDIIHELKDTKHLNRIYYDESIISLEKLVEIYQPKAIYAKNSWKQQCEEIHKFYEL